MIKTVGDLIRKLQEYPETMAVVGSFRDANYPACISVRTGVVDLKNSEWNPNSEDDDNAVIVETSY